MSQREKQNNGSNQSTPKLIDGIDDDERNRALRVKVLFDAVRTDQGEDCDGGLRKHAQRLLPDGNTGEGLGVEHDGEDGGGANGGGDDGVDHEAGHGGVVDLDALEGLDAFVDARGAVLGLADDEGVVDAGEEELGDGGEEERDGDVLEGGSVEENFAEAIVASGHFD